MLTEVLLSLVAVAGLVADVPVATSQSDAAEAGAQAATKAIESANRGERARVARLEACRRSAKDIKYFPENLLAEIKRNPEIGPDIYALEVCVAYIQGQVDLDQQIIDRYEKR
ncbi:MAG: hypothetical protein WBL74_03085 [Novosphingobium sp.]|uniref:hypothetical protein n=1 Tax=Novosphingobium sp. TaxID=1874826 RepID=UPI003C7C3B79